MKDDQGTTPLQVAAYSLKEDLVKLLLKHGADPNLSDRKGVNSLIAAAIGCLKLTEELAEQRKRLDQYSANDEVVNELEDKNERASQRIKSVLNNMLPVIRDVNKTEEVSVTAKFRQF